MTIHPATQPPYAKPASIGSTRVLVAPTRTAAAPVNAGVDTAAQRTSPVFVDDSGRRALIVRFVTTVLALGVAAASVMLLIALAMPSAVPLP